MANKKPLQNDDLKEAQIILNATSNEQKEEFREAFKLFDKDGDGSITADEIHTVFTNLGFKQYTKKDIKKMVSTIDIDGDGEIDLDEFIYLLNKKKKGKSAQLSWDKELKQAFDVFDIDGNGDISAEELANIMKALGENLNKDDIEFMMKSVDTNSDGTIDFTEFKAMMQLQPVKSDTVAKLTGGDNE
mmetsp:Transcript_3394/g.4182  ORF Transcript_3394/g.4182 Transcript_3394/m.4182 type:complete len:188 (-) Transcript_3394:287-850(-)